MKKALINPFVLLAKDSMVCSDFIQNAPAKNGESGVFAWSLVAVNMIGRPGMDQEAVRVCERKRRRATKQLGAERERDVFEGLVGDGRT